MEKKNVMKRIVEDFKVLSEEFQVLADDFNVLLKFEEMYGEQGYKCSSHENNKHGSSKSALMGHAEGNNNENNGNDVESGQVIEVENEKGPGDSNNYSAWAASDTHPAAKTADSYPVVNTTENEDKEITIETVRSLLLQKTRSGKVKEVKELIKKYGADKLTDLNPSCYKELLKEAQNI